MLPGTLVAVPLPGVVVVVPPGLVVVPVPPPIGGMVPVPPGVTGVIGAFCKLAKYSVGVMPVARRKSPVLRSHLIMAS